MDHTLIIHRNLWHAIRRIKAQGFRQLSEKEWRGRAPADDPGATPSPKPPTAPSVVSPLDVCLIQAVSFGAWYGG
jgi:hypothetical protein